LSEEKYYLGPEVHFPWVKASSQESQCSHDIGFTNTIPTDNYIVMLGNYFTYLEGIQVFEHYSTEAQWPRVAGTHQNTLL
jgi:hypothetical protein